LQSSAPQPFLIAHESESGPVFDQRIKRTDFGQFARYRNHATNAKKPVSDEYHGTTVEDPYQWLEKDDDPQVKAWSNAQNQRTRDYLGKLPDRAAIEKQLADCTRKLRRVILRSSRAQESCSR